MIEKAGYHQDGVGDWEVICDICNAELTISDMTFYEVLDELKLMDWENRKNKYWEQFCPECK